MSTTAGSTHESRPAPSLGDCRPYAKLPVKDVGRAQRFYAEQLGLTPFREVGPGHYQYQCGGLIFLLFPSRGQASGTHDQMGWFVDDIDGMVRALKNRGVVFETFPDSPGDTWTGEIADNGGRRGAWFRDSEGNLLNLVQLKGR